MYFHSRQPHARGRVTQRRNETKHGGTEPRHFASRKRQPEGEEWGRKGSPIPFGVALFVSRSTALSWVIIVAVVAVVSVFVEVGLSRLGRPGLAMVAPPPPPSPDLALSTILELL